jgi:hypothetical protein
MSYITSLSNVAFVMDDTTHLGWAFLAKSLVDKTKFGVHLD